ncbi:MAG: hypothetical protein A2Y23_09950 [Clostridiales bacterium GWB2_37_7]|nr:MAG: hypothetical protein A2Y23_09950 [Clostridiales bacterium GWB2_37_7]
MEFIVQNWWYILLIGAFAYMMFKGGGCCGGGHNHTEHHRDNNKHGSELMNNQIEMVLDPECGMTINPETAIKQNIDGKVYYFCSEACRSNFLKKNQASL